jgi:hypothetical protein
MLNFEAPRWQNRTKESVERVKQPFHRNRFTVWGNTAIHATHNMWRARIRYPLPTIALLMLRLFLSPVLFSSYRRCW